MAILSSTAGAQSASQFGWEQLKLQQAQRNAEQAQQTAQSLQAQAQDAQRTADKAQDNARSLSVQADQAQSDAGRAEQGLAAIRTNGQAQTQLTNALNQAAPQPAVQPAAAAPVQQKPAPVVNAQGQTTGRVINTSA